jgi:hypothetical protein
LILLILCGLASLDSLYQSGSYAELVRQAPAALESSATRTDSAAVMRLHGYGLVALGRGDEAAEQFKMLLAIAPDTRLDPETVSPKIRQVFERARLDIAARRENLPPARTDTLTLRTKPSLAVLVPGLEQVRTREPGKGYALLAAGLAAVAGSVFTHLEYNDAHRYYLEQTELGKIQQSYRVADNWHKARMVSISATGLIWLVSLLDATVF